MPCVSFPHITCELVPLDYTLLHVVPYFLTTLLHLSAPASTLIPYSHPPTLPVPYHPTSGHLTTLQVAKLYSILDKNGDEQVTVETIVRALMVDMFKNSGETNVAVKRKQEAELVALVLPILTPTPTHHPTPIIPL